MIAKSTTNPVFVSAHRGADTAAKELAAISATVVVSVITMVVIVPSIP